jgi:hypothetical protein
MAGINPTRHKSSIVAFIMAAFGSWIAGQRGRSGFEGFILGFLFGPLGVLVEALLPPGQSRTPSVQTRDRVSEASTHSGWIGLDDQGTVAYIVDRYRSYLDEVDPAWMTLSPHRKRALLKTLDYQLRKELKLTPTQFAGFAADARRTLFGVGPKHV